MKAPLDMVQWVLPASLFFLSFTRSSLASLSPVKKGTDLSLLVWWVGRGHSPNRMGAGHRILLQHVLSLVTGLWGHVGSPWGTGEEDSLGGQGDAGRVV